MGSALCTLFRQRNVRVLWFGLDAAGKTTLLYRLKLGEVVSTIPTIGFNVETLDINGVQMIAWDLGLRVKTRALVRHYLPGTDGVVLMFDSSDSERLQEGINEFFHYIVPALEEQQFPVLVLANKQDKEKVMSADHIKQAILAKGTEAFRNNTVLEVFPTVGTTLEGVDAAFQWLTSHIALQLAQKRALSPVWSASKVIHYPASVLKSSYLRVAGLFGGNGESHGEAAEEKSSAK